MPSCGATSDWSAICRMALGENGSYEPWPAGVPGTTMTPAPGGFSRKPGAVPSSGMPGPMMTRLGAKPSSAFAGLVNSEIGMASPRMARKR